MSETWFQSYARAAVLAALKLIQHGRIVVTCKYGAGDFGKPETYGEQGANGKPGQAISIVVNSPSAWIRICQAFDLGFAEAYMFQELDCDNLAGLFSLYIANRERLGFSSSILHRAIPQVMRLIFTPTNDLFHAKMNASFHYDTSNILFSSFLSSDMNYSSALWSGNRQESLEVAQVRKVRNILDKARISSTDHVLDIGCGWGHLAIEAVKRTGCRVTGVTLSAEQKEMAEERIKALGLEKNITILLCDYRQITKPEGGFDRVISVEMLEHVGDKFMNDFFASISSLLNEKEGIMVIQGITMIKSIRNSTPDVDTFIDRYVFPGGYLPTVSQLLSAIDVGSQGTLEVETVQSIGPHYIKTLRCWRENFIRNWGNIKSGYVANHAEASEKTIEAYRRRWLYYFYYCEAAFRARIIGDCIISAVRTPEVVIEGEVIF
ncbi:hypothetical protein NQ176_g3654 [Zarea fungicola]|uniref:Uncharacterized protein n=1 Tax=Zarea fungicola TaxID=93591 RepID=A0ACC1NHJ1_9HYPO|nr:hypothetical protein NQ176_g3654 [Lecanicillium fungicola]